MKRLKKKIFSKNKTQKLNNKKGMTYVELLCALSLLMLIVVMFSPMLLDSYDALYKAGEKTYTIYGGKKEIEKGLTFRGKHDDFAEGIEINFKTLSTVVLIKAKQVVTSMPGLETLYSDSRGIIAVPSELSLPDNQDAQIIKMKFSNTSFDGDKNKILITNEEPTADDFNGKLVAYQFTSAFNPDKDFSNGAEIVKTPNMDTENPANYDPNIHIMIKGVDITDSPIRVRVYYLSGGAVKYSESHYYITPADMMFVGDTGAAEYFTSAGVPENGGDMLVAGRNLPSEFGVSGNLNDVKWISGTNDSTLADGYYMMCGENSVVRRLWHFTPGTLSVGTRSRDFSSLLSTGAHYVYGGDVAYPFKWAGDYTDTYSWSVNSSDSVYDNADHDYNVDQSCLRYGYNGYTVNAGSLNNGIWAPSEIAARNIRISYVMTGSDKGAAKFFGATDAELADDTNKPYEKYLYQDGYITRHGKRGGGVISSRKYDHFTNGYAGSHDKDQEHVYCSDDGYWYRRKGAENFVRTNYKGYNTWFDESGGDTDNARRYGASDEWKFSGRKWVPDGTQWGVNEAADTPNATDIACLVLKAYNNYDRTHLTNNTYQGVDGTPKVNMTSCVVLPGKDGESLCFGTTNAYALINETTAKDPEFLRPGYMNSYKIESVGNTTYAKKYSHEGQEFDQISAALNDYRNNTDVDDDKTRQLANDGKAASDGAFETYADTYFTMGYSSNLSAVYDKFIKENSGHLEKPLESIYLACKNTNAKDDGYHNMWLTREFYNLTASDSYNKSVVAAGYNVAGAAKQGYIKRAVAPYKYDSNQARIAPMDNFHTADGKLDIPDPAVNPAGMWSKGWGRDANDSNYWALTFRDLYGYEQDDNQNTCVDDFWVQLPMGTIGYTEFDRITNDAVLSVYTEGVKTFAPILYYKESDGSSVRFNSVSVSNLNDKKVGIAAGTSNGKLFVLFPDYVEGVISSAPISMSDSSRYKMYPLADSFASIDAVKACNVVVEGASKFCVFFSGKSVASGNGLLGVYVFNNDGSLFSSQEHALTNAGDANIKDICVSDDILYAVGCKASSNADTNNGVIYSCNVIELVSNSVKGDKTSTKWNEPVISYSTEFKSENGVIVANGSTTLPALKAVAALKEED